MVGVAEITILYLLAKNIKIDCDYCIFNDNAVPLNTCFNQSDISSTLKSYQFVCHGVNDGNIFKLDYSDWRCSASAKQTLSLEYSCSLNNGIMCSSYESVLISVSDTHTHHQTRIIINKCALISNISLLTQCTDTSITEWRFNDIGCTSLSSAVTYSNGDLYQYDLNYINIIYCPSCNLTTDYNINTVQINLDINYIITNDGTYAFPEAMDVCNAFVFNDIHNYTNASYKYSCYFGNVYQTIWKYNCNCNGLYDDIIQPSYLDFNCFNGNNMYIQPSYVHITRYNNKGLCDADLSNRKQIAYIVNKCIKQNDDTSIIIETQLSFIFIHFFTDDDCINEVSQCLKIIKTNDCDIVINDHFGAIRESITLTPITTTKDVLDVEMSIDAQSMYIETNYINRHNYREPINVCNQLVEYGVKSSYKYVCQKNIYKKRKWKNKYNCDALGDRYDEEEDIEYIQASCDHDQDIKINYCKINCFHDYYYWEQKAVILNNCIQINNQQNSVYIECFSQHTVAYYYKNNDCTDYDYKEHWFGKDCESRYSKSLRRCNPTYDTTTTMLPTSTPLRIPSQVPSTSTSSSTSTSTSTSTSPSTSTAPSTSTSASIPTPLPTSNTNSPVDQFVPTISPGITPAPIFDPTQSPIFDPTIHPSFYPTISPTSHPTINPSFNPTINPTAGPSFDPTPNPTANPTLSPTINPTLSPTINPTFPPTISPTVSPTINPTISPTVIPTMSPTVIPTISPTISPTVIPTSNPTISPSIIPTISPTKTPTIFPTINPTNSPTIIPSIFPTIVPTLSPIINPSISPTSFPTIIPTINPSIAPTMIPTISPTIIPTVSPTTNPTISPSIHPTISSTITSITNPTITATVPPSTNPSLTPTINPTIFPSINPSITPTVDPTVTATNNPTITQTTINPTQNPSINPTVTIIPTTLNPTQTPSAPPTALPSTSFIPTTLSPSDPPISTIPTTEHPTLSPTVQPTVPSNTPTLFPTAKNCEFQFYQRYNQTNASYWLSDDALTDQYAGFVQEAIFLTLQNLTGHSMDYEDGDEWSDQTWTHAGIVDYKTCMIFSIKNDDPNIPSNCPSVPNPDAGNAQFVVVVTFCVVADQNVDDFNDYLLDISDLANFSAIFDFYLNPIVAENTPNIVLSLRTHITIESHGLNPLHSNELKTLPMGYQGIFTDKPPVTGDIIILLIIVCSLISICAFICWCIRHKCGYMDQPYTLFHDQNDMDQYNYGDNREDQPLPLRK